MKRKVFILTLFATLFGAGWLVFEAARSTIFVVRNVEIIQHPASAPVSAQAVNNLAAVPVGQTNLFFLNLKEVEKRILMNRWVREVRLWKRFPGTLQIAVKFREPKGIFQNSDGSITYVDNEGAVFGEVNLSTHADLPVFSGFKAPTVPETKGLIRDAVEFAETWEHAKVSKVSEISAVSWDLDKGVRATLVYPLKSVNRNARVTLEVGNLAFLKTGLTWRVMDSNLQKVLLYLSNNAISAHQIFVGDGKKIVVRTAPGS